MPYLQTYTSDLSMLKIYVSQIKALYKKSPKHIDVLNLIRFFKQWRVSLKYEVSPIKDERPWMTFGAIRFLEKNLEPHMKVYEYGSGGSTIFFSKRVKEVVSIEHNKDWYEIVIKALEEANYQNFTLYLVEPQDVISVSIKDPSNPESYISSSSFYSLKSFEKYAKSIDTYPDHNFDVVVIDGRARPSCFKSSISKVKRDGFLVLDNAEREHYSYIHRNLNNKNWIKHSFYGSGPYNPYFWETCIWQRVN